jgi:hypothetical protein
VDFLSSAGQVVAHVPGKVGGAAVMLAIAWQVKIVACDARKLEDKR